MLRKPCLNSELGQNRLCHFRHWVAVLNLSNYRGVSRLRIPKWLDVVAYFDRVSPRLCSVLAATCVDALEILDVTS